jgi:hypothetical protein
MKNKFLQELNIKLILLNKKERKKYLDNYEEHFYDKKEDGLDEKQIIQELNSVNEISGEIIESYNEKEIEKSKVSIFWNYYNKLLVLMDLIMLAIIIVTTIFVFYQDGGNINVGEAFIDQKDKIIHARVMYSIRVLMIYALPLFVLLNYLFGLYKIRKENLILDMLKRISIHFLLILALSYGFIELSSIVNFIIFAVNLFVSTSIYSIIYFRKMR